jgi:hypothetical protein
LLLKRTGLGLMVGAVLHGTALAQVRDTTRARADSIARARADSLSRLKPDSSLVRDTTRVPAVPLPPPKDTIPKDTIKAPLARAELPVVADPGGSFHWNRLELSQSAAQTVADLLDRVPGITTLRTGSFAPPIGAAFLGDVHRVRVFVDGVELDPLDPHSGGVMDLSQIPLWEMEEVTVERGASEVRVWLRTWRVDRTTPYTRTDISTGDQQTNLYRALFGRRWGQGEVLQFGVQQYGTTPERGTSTSDQLTLFARLGFARGRFSLDGYISQIGRHRGTMFDQETGDSLGTLETTARDAYLRAGYGDPDAGPWVQAVAASRRYTFSGAATTVPPPPTTTTTPAPVVPGDTSLSQAQYLLTGGLTRWGIRLSGAERYRVENRRSLSTPSARASYDWRRLSVSGFAEGKGPDSVSRREGSAVLTPLSFIRFSGAVGSTRDGMVDTAVASAAYRRLGAELRIHDLWLGGGIIRRGAVSLAAPTLVNDTLVRQSEAAAAGSFASVQGRLWHGVYADAFAIKWSDSTGLYRPQYETRSELYINTGLLDRFPRGTFHITAAITHTYHSTTWFPTGALGVESMPGYRAIGGKLQIRIVNATLTYQINNMLGEIYGEVPGFLQPKQSSLYGVQWEFWN